MKNKKNKIKIRFYGNEVRHEKAYEVFYAR